MDGVLEGAVVLCVCKLVSSLLFLPLLAESHSPVSFCSCCLLFFTDFLVTVFLTFLSIFEPWLANQTAQLSDVIALRVLLFLGHTYGAVMLLTTPLIAVETLTRLLWPPSTDTHWTESQAKDDGLHCFVWEEAVEKEEDRDKEKRFSHVVSYLCCLSVWVVVALNVSWRSKLEEVLTSSCLHTTNSLVRCLPNLFSPMPSFVHPCWGIAFLSLLMLLLSTSTSLDGWHLVLGCLGQEKHRESRSIRSSSDNCWQDFVLVPSERESSCKSEPEAEQCVDPEKTESSCTIHKAYSWNSMKMSTSHHGDFVLIPPDVVSAGKGGQEYGGTKRSIRLTFIADNHVDSEHRRQFCWGQWGFPCPRVNVMIGFMGVLSVFVLPLNLSVNILLIRTIETLLELCVRSLVNTNNPPTLTLHNETHL
ncbi:uncharacterized protein LOC141791493 isoform X2 [Halichoeres trimaculatus]